MCTAETEFRRRCRPTRVEQMAEAVPGLVRAGRPRSRVASFRDVVAAKDIYQTCVYLWFAFNTIGSFFLVFQ